MALDFRESEGVPVSRDIGNKEVQGRVVSKTIQMALFTTNRNAVWAGDLALRKASYPFANLTITVNRNLFRLQVGDCFKFTYSPYDISNMIYRVLAVEENNLDTESIVITAMEDPYSKVNSYAEADDPVKHSIAKTDFSVTPLVHQNVIESFFALSGDEDLAVIPMAARVGNYELGYLLYMSSDGGSSYEFLKSVGKFNPCGTLVEDYPKDTYNIDDEVGITIDFVNSDISKFDNLTRQALLGVSNLAIVGNEIMTIQKLTPINGGSGIRYRLTGIYRARFGTGKEAHSAGDGIYLIDGNSLIFIKDSAFLPSSERKFKFVPFSAKVTGELSESLVTDLIFSSTARNPYNPENFRANGLKKDPTYSDDIVLTWSPRVRGTGAGYYIPSKTDAYPTWEGYFEIGVYVSDVLVRTKDKVDDFTWTYTEAMNIADNGSLAEEVTFKLTNFIDYEEWDQAKSDRLELTVRRV
ncbi:MAG: hypothetical protein JXB42_01680 [Deltaproteobacteria bacterium]|nr:hypothetical protein [Deltaproteobacteria bacterium]